MTEIEVKSQSEESEGLRLLKQIYSSRKLNLEDLKGAKIIKGSFGNYYATLKNGQFIGFCINVQGQL